MPPPSPTGVETIEAPIVLLLLEPLHLIDLFFIYIYSVTTLFSSDDDDELVNLDSSYK